MQAPAAEPSGKVETENNPGMDEAEAPDQKPPEEEDEDGMKKMRKDMSR